MGNESVAICVFCSEQELSASRLKVARSISGKRKIFQGLAAPAEGNDGLVITLERCKDSKYPAISTPKLQQSRSTVELLRHYYSRYYVLIHIVETEHNVWYITCSPKSDSPSTCFTSIHITG